MPTKYHIERNNCDCRPETCLCNKWSIVDDSNKKYASFYNYKDAEPLKALLNSLSVYKDYFSIALKTINAIDDKTEYCHTSFDISSHTVNINHEVKTIRDSIRSLLSDFTNRLVELKNEQS